MADLLGSSPRLFAVPGPGALGVAGQGHPEAARDGRRRARRHRVGRLGGGLGHRSTAWPWALPRLRGWATRRSPTSWERAPRWAPRRSCPRRVRSRAASSVPRSRPEAGGSPKDSSEFELLACFSAPVSGIRSRIAAVSSIPRPRFSILRLKMSRSCVLDAQAMAFLATKPSFSRHATSKQRRTQ